MKRSGRSTTSRLDRIQDALAQKKREESADLESLYQDWLNTVYTPWKDEVVQARLNGEQAIYYGGSKNEPILCGLPVASGRFLKVPHASLGCYHPRTILGSFDAATAACELHPSVLSFVDPLSLDPNGIWAHYRIPHSYINEEVRGDEEMEHEWLLVQEACLAPGV